MEGSGLTTEVLLSPLKPSLLLSHEITKNKLKKIINPIDTFFKSSLLTNLILSKLCGKTTKHIILKPMVAK